MHAIEFEGVASSLSNANISRYRDLIGRLPVASSYSRDQILTDDFFLERAGNLEVFYAPFDHLNDDAEVVLVGVTPGWTQVEVSFVAARTAIAAGMHDEAVLREAKRVASFSGGLRRNLVSMLDQIGVAIALGLPSSAELFDSASGLLHPTSAIRYPVFKAGRNYTGSVPSITKSPLLIRYLNEILAPELGSVSHGLVIPLGRAVELALGHLIQAGRLDVERCLFGFPHPSGANAHRASQFAVNRSRLEAQVTAWFSGRPTVR